MPAHRASRVRHRARPAVADLLDVASLQKLLPRSTGGVKERGGHPGSIEMQSHLVRRRGRVQSHSASPRGTAALAEAGLPGYAFDVPAPAPYRRLLWASISTPWQYWEWDGWGPSNDSSASLRIQGSVSWLWVLTGNPSVFPDAPELMSNGGEFEFYTSIPANGSGFAAAWLDEPHEKAFARVSPIKGAPSPLGQLLSVLDGEVLRLWIALDFQGAKLDGIDWAGPGAFWGGPQSISVVYAYLGPPLPVADPNGAVRIA